VPGLRNAAPWLERYVKQDCALLEHRRYRIRMSCSVDGGSPSDGSSVFLSEEGPSDLKAAAGRGSAEELKEMLTEGARPSDPVELLRSMPPRSYEAVAALLVHVPELGTMTWEDKNDGPRTVLDHAKASGDARLVELLQRALPRQRLALGLVDARTGERIDALLAAVLRGKPLPDGAAGGLSDDSLTLLRNAVFARHGRVFKNPDLQAFFYGKCTTAGAPAAGAELACWPAASELPRLEVNEAYSDDVLDETDRATVDGLVAEAERRKR
jgi:hypothetical protein